MTCIAVSTPTNTKSVTWSIASSSPMSHVVYMSEIALHEYRQIKSKVSFINLQNLCSLAVICKDQSYSFIKFIGTLHIQAKRSFH